MEFTQTFSYCSSGMETTFACITAAEHHGYSAAIRQIVSELAYFMDPVALKGTVVSWPQEMPKLRAVFRSKN